MRRMRTPLRDHVLDRVRALTRDLTRAAQTVALSALALTAVAGCTADPTVVSVAVDRITLTPGTASVSAGGTISLSAALSDAAGQAIVGQPISWSSNNTAVATVSRSGVVTTLAPGGARIAASAYGKSAVATITVTARPVAVVVVTPASVSMQAGVTSPLQARTLDSDGNVLTGRSVSWTSSNTAVATVSQTGVVTALAPGATTITATSEGRSAQSAVTVTLAPVTSVTVTPVRDTIGVGTSRQLSVLLRDATGATLTGRVVTWSSTNVSVATVSSTGLVVGLAPGTVTVSGTSEGRVGSATIVVLARLASSVILTPSTGTLVVGATQPLTTQVTDADGNLLSGRPVTFSSDAPAVATVSATGVVTAVSAGTVRITGTSEGKTGSASFTVIPVPVATVSISPSPVTLLPNSSQQLTAVARSAAGAVLTGRTVTWLSGAPSVAVVAADGRVTGVGNGVTIVLAFIDGVSSSVTVIVAPPAVSTVVITPVDPTVAIGEAVQLTATLRDANSALLSGRTITWSSADESIAFVSSTGQVVGFKAGTVRITATSEGVSASTLVTVR